MTCFTKTKGDKQMSKKKFFLIQAIFDLIYPTAMYFAALYHTDGTILSYDEDKFNELFIPAAIAYAILNVGYIVFGRGKKVFEHRGFIFLGLLIMAAGALLMPLGVIAVVFIHG